jgi:hypothetical protein
LTDIGEVKIQNEMPTVIHFDDSRRVFGYGEKSADLSSRVGRLFFQRLSLRPEDRDTSERNSSGNASQLIKPFTDSYLFFPIVTLIGAMLFIGGGIANDRGYETNIGGCLHVTGWLAFALGGAILILVFFSVASSSFASSDRRPEVAYYTSLPVQREPSFKVQSPQERISPCALLKFSYPCCSPFSLLWG